MKCSKTWLLLAVVGCASGVAQAQLEMAANSKSQCVFCDGAKKISVTIHNPTSQNFDGEINLRIFQTTSATAVLISENQWKRLQVPAQETVLDSATVKFPIVNAETKFLVQWLEDKNQVIGEVSLAW